MSSLTTLAEPELYQLWREGEGRASVGEVVRAVARRDPCRRRFAYAIPSNAVLAFLAGYGPFVEIGAGTGYWAWLLGERGCAVVPYDSNVKGDHDERTYCDVDLPFLPIGKGGPERAADHPDHALLLIWPPYSTPMAHDALRAYTGTTVAYIGEGAGGCTGDDAFHDLLDAAWEEVAEHAVPQWYGLHDHLWVYRRRVARLP